METSHKFTFNQLKAISFLNKHSKYMGLTITGCMHSIRINAHVLLKNEIRAISNADFMFAVVDGQICIY